MFFTINHQTKGKALGTGECTEGFCHNLPMNGDSQYTTGPADLPTGV